jgi:ABC-type sugar transport system permease subunit
MLGSLMKPDHLSELIPGSLAEICRDVETNERLTIRISEEKGVKGLTVKRQPNITFWQALAATVCFPILVAILSVVIWKLDTSGAAIEYFKDNLKITVTGLFAAWIISLVAIGWLFRFIRES